MAGKTPQAIADLEAARAIAEELGLLNERWQIDAALGSLLLVLADTARSGWWFTQAAQAMQVLAGAIDDQGLRSTFLAAEPVRHVLAMQE